MAERFTLTLREASLVFGLLEDRRRHMMDIEDEDEGEAEAEGFAASPYKALYDRLLAEIRSHNIAVLDQRRQAA
jgi:hypothetical protein